MRSDGKPGITMEMNSRITTQSASSTRSTTSEPNDALALIRSMRDREYAPANSPTRAGTMLFVANRMNVAAKRDRNADVGSTGRRIGSQRQARTPMVAVAVNAASSSQSGFAARISASTFAASTFRSASQRKTMLIANPISAFQFTPRRRRAFVSVMTEVAR